MDRRNGFKFKKIIFPIIILLILSGKMNVFPDSPNPDNKWYWLAGEWSVENNAIIEKRGWVNPWHMYALLDFNSIITIETLKNYDTIEFSMTPYNKPVDNVFRGNRTLEDKVEIMASFAITSPSGEWYYQLYGFMFTGDKNKINNISLVHSDMTDKTKKLNDKNNYFIKELASTNTNLDYDKLYKIKIIFKKNIVEISINGRKILQGDMSNDGNLNGKIAFSVRNAYLKIGDVKVRGNKGLIFDDKFDKDSLHIRKLKVRRVENQK